MAIGFDHVNNRVTGLATPSASTDSATKSYVDSLSPAHGRCRLVVTNSTTVTLNPFNGNSLIINSTVRSIPSAGVTLASNDASITQGASISAYSSTASTSTTYTTSAAHGYVVGQKVFLVPPSAVSGPFTNIVVGTATITAVGSTTTFTVANTAAATASATITMSVVPLQWIYAYYTGSAIALEASVNPPTTDTTTGFMVKSGTAAGGGTTDSTRTLVGMFTMINTGIWNDSGSLRLVRSYFNRPQQVASLTLSGTYTGSATAEFTTSRVYATAFADDEINHGFVGYQVMTTSGLVASSRPMVNGVLSGNPAYAMSSAATGYGCCTTYQPTIYTAADGCNVYSMAGEVNNSGNAMQPVGQQMVSVK